MGGRHARRRHDRDARGNVAGYGRLRAQREAAHHGAFPEDRPRRDSHDDDDRGSGVFYEAIYLRTEPASNAEGYAADARALRRQRALTRRCGARGAGARAQEAADVSLAGPTAPGWAIR